MKLTVSTITDEQLSREEVLTLDTGKAVVDNRGVILVRLDAGWLIINPSPGVECYGSAYINAIGADDLEDLLDGDLDGTVYTHYEQTVSLFMDFNA